LALMVRCIGYRTIRSLLSILASRIASPDASVRKKSVCRTLCALLPEAPVGPPLSAGIHHDLRETRKHLHTTLTAAHRSSPTSGRPRTSDSIRRRSLSRDVPTKDITALAKHPLSI
jgi:hypothetical protein